MRSSWNTPERMRTRSGSLRWRDEFRLAGAAAVEIGLDVGFGERDARRAAIDHAAERRPVAFAEGRDAEQMAEAVVLTFVIVLATAMSGASSAFMPTM